MAALSLHTAVMASLQAQLQASFMRAFKAMEQGSQLSEESVLRVVAPLCVLVCNFDRASELRPHVLDLLHVAGWLYPCILPSSPFRPSGQLAVRSYWQSCLAAVNSVWSRYPLNSMDAFLPLLEPRSRPHVPGGSHVWHTETCMYHESTVLNYHTAHHAATLHCSSGNIPMS